MHLMNLDNGAVGAARAAIGSRIRAKMNELVLCGLKARETWRVC